MNAEQRLTTRDEFVDHLRQQLVGPAGGESETVKGMPYWRYLSGLLYPKTSNEIGKSGDAEGGASSGDESDPALTSAYDRLPSSLGISFLLEDAPEMVVSVTGALYKKLDSPRDGLGESENGDSTDRVQATKAEWRREALAERETPETVRIAVPAIGAGIAGFPIATSSRRARGR